MVSQFDPTYKIKEPKSLITSHEQLKAHEVSFSKLATDPRSVERLSHKRTVTADFKLNSLAIESSQ